jgi:hypothetical protein
VLELQLLMDLPVAVVLGVAVVRLVELVREPV